MRLLLIAGVITLIPAGITSRIVFCYYGSWSSYRTGNGKFTPANINPNLCTHIGYSFFGITTNGEILSLDTYLDFKDNWGLGYIKDVIDLKQINPKLKVLAVVGGYNQGSITFSNVAADPVKRKTFVDSSLAFIMKHGFDGLDLDWEYPAQRGGSSGDKENFVTLLKELRIEFNKKNKLLSIAVGATPNLAKPSYNIQALHPHLDFINLMTYDLYGPWNGITGNNAPLFNWGTYSVQKAVTYWISQGAPSQKLILGLPFYGRSFTLSNPANHGIDAPSSGAGSAGQFTKEPGFLGYNEICLDKSWNVAWDNNQRVPFAYKDNQWVGFDNVQSIGEKVDYALSENLGGVMIWSIETDDFRGTCGSGKYPLLQKAFSAINSGIVNPPVKPTTATTTKRPTPKPPITGKDSCEGKVDGFYRSSINCSKFYQCAEGLKYDFSCPGDLLFNTSNNVCDYPENVQC